MQRALRPYVTAGVAIIGAGAIAGAPLLPTEAIGAKAERAVRLAADSVANIPANLALTVANIPANEIAAINAFADSLFMTGTWWVYTSTNVLGTDPADPPKLKSLASMALPFGPGAQTIGSVLGDQLNIIQEAELPMDPGCTAIPGGCDNPNALLGKMFRVPLSELMAGYNFGTVVNPVDGQPTPWSNTTVYLDPLAPVTTFYTNLTKDPGQVQTVSATDTITAGQRVLQGLWVDFYPFVKDSEIYNPNMTYLAYLFRPFAPALCGCSDPYPGYPNIFTPPDPTPIPGLDQSTLASSLTSAAAAPATGAGAAKPAAAQPLLKVDRADLVPAVKTLDTRAAAADTLSPPVVKPRNAAAAADKASVKGFGAAAKAVRDAVDTTVSKLTGGADKKSGADGAPGAPAGAAKSAGTGGKHHKAD